MTRPWLRLYRSALNNPKIGKLGLEATGMWAICLMLSDDEGALPDDEGIAWASRHHVDAVTEMMGVLLRHGLVTRYGNGYRLHDWDQHQRASDYDLSGAERQKRFRERQKAQKSAADTPVTDSNALRHGNVTLPDTDTDTDKTLTSFVPTQLVVPDAPKPKKAKPLPPDFVIPYPWITDAMRLREQQGKGPIPYAAEADRFVNHFVANGKVMKDWRRAWLNWATSPYVDKLNTGGGSNGRPVRAGETLGALFEGIARDRDRDGEV